MLTAISTARSLARTLASTYYRVSLGLLCDCELRHKSVTEPMAKVWEICMDGQFLNCQTVDNKIVGDSFVVFLYLFKVVPQQLL